MKIKGFTQLTANRELIISGKESQFYAWFDSNSENLSMQEPLEREPRETGWKKHEIPHDESGQYFTKFHLWFEYD